MHIIQPDFVATQLILFDNFKLKLCEIFYIPYFVLRYLITSGNTSWSKNHLFLIMLTLLLFSRASCTCFARGSP